MDTLHDLYRRLLSIYEDLEQADFYDLGGIIDRVRDVTIDLRESAYQFNFYIGAEGVYQTSTEVPLYGKTTRKIDIESKG